MTPADLIAEADVLDAAGRVALARGDADAAALAFDQANVRRAAAAKMAPAANALPPVVNASTIDRVTFTPEHRVALSRAVTAPKDKFAKAVHDAGLTMAGLARAVGLHPSHVTLARQGKRPMPAAAGARIQELTRSAALPDGYPITAWSRLS